MSEWKKTKIQNLCKRDTGVYYVQVKVSGKQFRRSLGTKKLDIARMKLPRALINLRAMDVTSGKNGLAGVLDEWWEAKKMSKEMRPETLRYWENAMKRVLSKLDGSKQLSDKEAVQWWADHVRGVVSSNFANNILSMMSGVMQREIDTGRRSNNPFAGIKRMKVHANELALPSKEQFRRLVAHVRGGDRSTSDESADMLEWIAYSGMRRGEVNALQWCDVHDREIVVRGKQDVNDKGRAGTKNGLVRRVPVSEALREVIVRRKQARIDERVFTIINPKKSLSNACVAVGCVHLTPHDFRHMFATSCIESGVDIFTVANWLGHQDKGALAQKTYGHLRDAHSQDQMRNVQF